MRLKPHFLASAAFNFAGTYYLVNNEVLVGQIAKKKFFTNVLKSLD